MSDIVAQNVAAAGWVKVLVSKTIWAHQVTAAAALNMLLHQAISTVDTDVVVVAVSSFSKIKADELWVSFGTRKHFRYIPIHDLVATLDPRRSCKLPIFHAITRWDTVSAFAGQGGKGLGSLASLPRSFRCVCGAYEHAKQAEWTISGTCGAICCLAISKISESMTVNEARK